MKGNFASLLKKKCKTQAMRKLMMQNCVLLLMKPRMSLNESKWFLLWVLLTCRFCTWTNFQSCLCLRSTSLTLKSSNICLLSSHNLIFETKDMIVLVTQEVNGMDCKLCFWANVPMLMEWITSSIYDQISLCLLYSLSRILTQTYTNCSI